MRNTTSNEYNYDSGINSDIFFNQQSFNSVVSNNPHKQFSDDIFRSLNEVTGRFQDLEESHFNMGSQLLNPPNNTDSSSQVEMSRIPSIGNSFLDSGYKRIGVNPFFDEVWQSKKQVYLGNNNLIRSNNTSPNSISNQRKTNSDDQKESEEAVSTHSATRNAHQTHQMTNSSNSESNTKNSISRSEQLRQKKAKAKALLKEKNKGLDILASKPIKHESLIVNINHDKTQIDLEIDESRLDKKEIRALKNRLSAQRSRDRKKEEFDALRIKAELLMQENEKLKEELNRKDKLLDEMNERLKFKEVSKGEKLYDNLALLNDDSLFINRSFSDFSTQGVADLNPTYQFGGMSSPRRYVLMSGFIATLCLICFVYTGDTTQVLVVKQTPIKEKFNIDSFQITEESKAGPRRRVLETNNLTQTLDDFSKVDLANITTLGLLASLNASSNNETIDKANLTSSFNNVKKKKANNLNDKENRNNFIYRVVDKVSNGIKKVKNKLFSSKNTTLVYNSTLNYTNYNSTDMYYYAKDQKPDYYVPVNTAASKLNNPSNNFMVTYMRVHPLQAEELPKIDLSTLSNWATSFKVVNEKSFTTVSENKGIIPSYSNNNFGHLSCQKEVNEIYAEYLKLIQLLKKSSMCVRANLLGNIRKILEQNKEKMFKQNFADYLFDRVGLEEPYREKPKKNSKEDQNKEWSLTSDLPKSFENKEGQVISLKKMLNESKLHVDFQKKHCYIGDKKETKTPNPLPLKRFKSTFSNKTNIEPSDYSSLQFSIIENNASFSDYEPLEDASIKGEFNNLSLLQNNNTELKYNLICRINKLRAR